MTKKTELMPEAIRLREVGETYAKIAEKLGVTEKTVYRWLTGVKSPPKRTVSHEREWPINWTLDSLSDLPGFHRSAWEGNLVIIEIAQKQGNVFLPWYYRRLVEVAREFGDVPSRVYPWQFAIAGLPILAEWLTVPECMELATLIEERKPWNGRRFGSRTVRKDYAKAAAPLVTKIEHGIVKVVMDPPQSLDNMLTIPLLMRLLSAWMPMFDSPPLQARLLLPGKADHKLGNLLLHIFRHKPKNGGVK